MARRNCGLATALETALSPRGGGLRIMLGHGLEVAVGRSGVELVDVDAAEAGDPVTIEIPIHSLAALVRTLVSIRRAAARIAKERRAAACVGEALVQFARLGHAVRLPATNEDGAHGRFEPPSDRL